MTNLTYIQDNVVAHDRLASIYDRKHSEIFNPIEQARLRESLSFAVSNIQSAPSKPTVLDYGAGTGNVTLNLLDTGVRVLSADVSRMSLRILQKKLPSSAPCDLLCCSGVDLSLFRDSVFDMITCYSVLHHIPDYLSLIREFDRVLKPGGILYIDHELCPSYWTASPRYQEYSRLSSRLSSSPMLLKRLTAKCFDARAWKRWARRKFLNINKYNNEEGDIHVYQDDHIEWDQILLALPSFTVVQQVDYLVCQGAELKELWDSNRNAICDMRMLIAAKNG